MRRFALTPSRPASTSLSSPFWTGLRSFPWNSLKSMYLKTSPRKKALGTSRDAKVFIFFLIELAWILNTKERWFENIHLTKKQNIHLTKKQSFWKPLQVKMPQLGEASNGLPQLHQQWDELLGLPSQVGAPLSTSQRQRALLEKLVGQLRSEKQALPRDEFGLRCIHH